MKHPRIRHFFLLIAATVILTALALFPGRPAMAATTSVTYTVTYGQTAARSITSMVNSLRTGGSWYWNEGNTSKITVNPLPALTYDYDLERAAMTRAAEIALYYSHTRPNGRDCSTVCSGYGAYGENIAAGYTTATEVFNGWREESENHDGQGHRRNMLNVEANFTAIGIGHVICNGTHYWAMELGGQVKNTSATTANNSTQSITTAVDTSFLDKISISAPSPYQLNVGESYTISPQLLLSTKPSNGWTCSVPVSGSFTITTDKASVLSASGLTLTGLAEGLANVTVSGSSSYGSVSTTFEMRVGKIDLSYSDISLSKTSFTYSGGPVCPKPVVSYQGHTLTEGVDYNLTYARNDKCTKNTGGATVAAVGIGRFKGLRAVGFEILAADISTLKVTLTPAECIYDGLLQEPAVTIPGLTKNTDYRVEYSNNRSVGNGKVRITGTGNYTGTLELTFPIKSSSSGGSSGSSSSGTSAGTAAVKLKKPAIKTAVNVKTRKIKITWKKQSGVTGYQIRYKTGSSTKTVKVKKASTTKKTLSKLKKGKTYTITLRSYKTKNGTTTYSAWSKKKKVKVKK